MNTNPLNSSNKLFVEKANILHARVIWERRNDDKTRSLSRNERVIAWDEHEQWFINALGDPSKFIYFGVPKDFPQNKPIGVVRFELIHSQKDHFEVSIVNSSKFRSKGYGLNLLSSGISIFSKEINKKSIILAEVKKNNYKSNNLFITAGFLRCLSTKEGFYTYSFKTL